MDTRLTRARNSIARRTKSSLSVFGRVSPHRRSAARFSRPKGSTSRRALFDKARAIFSSLCPPCPAPDFSGSVRRRGQEAPSRASWALTFPLFQKLVARMKTMRLEDKIGKTSDRLLLRDPGSLAELRRMGTGGAGPLAFWASGGGMRIPRRSVRKASGDRLSRFSRS